MIVDFFLNYINYWPLAAFCALLLAGFNIPISEDAIIIASAAICQDNPKLVLPTIIFVYLGIVISDAITYLLGYFCSRGLSGFRKVNKLLKSNKKYVILNRLERHGFFTFISIRFIPLGVRNLLFISSGFFHLKFWKFVVFDFTAALISSQTLFWLIYVLGDDSSILEKAICVILLGVLVGYIVHTIKGVKKDLAALDNQETVGEQPNSLEK